MKYNSIKKIIAKVLIVAMILSSHGFCTFATGIDSSIEISQESNQEEITPDDHVEVSDDFGSFPTSTNDENEVDDEENQGEDEYDDEPEEDNESLTAIEETTEEGTTEEETTEEKITEEETTEEETTVEVVNSSFPSDDDSVDTSTISFIEDDIVLELSSESEINTIDEEIYDAGNMQTIILDFGENRPLVDKTTNWTNTKWSLNPERSISFDGEKGTSIYNRFLYGDGDDLNPQPYAQDIDAIKENYGSGNHIQLPVFQPWNGFIFDGWYNGDTKVTITTFKYAFQPTPDVFEYTANWIRDTSVTQKVDIRYYRATYSSVWGGTDTTIVNHELFDPYSETKHCGDYIEMDAKTIQGYKIARALVYNKAPGTQRTELGKDGLKVKDIDENYGVFDDEDLKMLDDYKIVGKVPNHDVYIEYYYEPDINDKQDVIIKYIDTNGNDLQGISDASYTAEEILVFDPPTLPGYSFVSGEVTTTYADANYSIFALGDLHVDGEKYTTSHINEDTDGDGKSDGHFKAVMPNQNIYITYQYELGGSDATYYVETRKQKPDGTYDISTTSDTITLGSATHKTITVQNFSNLGYKIAPDTDFQNVQTVAYNEPTGFGAAAQSGSIEFYVETINKPVVILIYDYDYTTPYWTKLAFNYRLPSAGGHGTIAAEAGSKSLNNRYVKRNSTYSLSNLVENLEVTPDNGYMVKWYKSNASGNAPDGNPLPDTGIAIGDVASFNLFADFVEDSSKWVDIRFIEAEHSSLSGTKSFHVASGSEVSAISLSLPSVIVDDGYRHAKNQANIPIWLDTNGNPLGDRFTASMTYKPYIVSTFPGSTTPVRPVLHVTYNSDGTGKANLFGTYDDRQYVLTDSNNKVLKVCNAAQSINGFNNLTQGTTYNMYEVLSGTTITIGQNISVGGSVSEKYEFGIDALRTAPNVVTNTNDTYTISLPEKAGISYAILDDRYSVISNWTSNPIFSNLTKGTYYLIVAKASSDNVSANDDSVIRNGYVVYTSINSLPASKKFKIIFFGSGNISGAILKETSAAGARIYEAEAGKTVRVTKPSGETGTYTTFALTNNVTLSGSDPTTPHQSNSSNVSFTMPAEDVALNRINLPNVVPGTSGNVPNTITVNTNSSKMSVLKFDEIRNTLNLDDTINEAIIDNSCEVNHYVEINRHATNKSVVQGLGSGIISPYEYTIDVQSVVLGIPFRANTIASCDFESYLAFDTGMLENTHYKLDGADVNCPYTTTSDTEIGAASFNLTVDGTHSISYKKRHKINVTSTEAALPYNTDFYVNDSELLSTAEGFATLRDNVLKTLFDNASSNANKKEYLYDPTKYSDTGLFDGTSAFDYTTKKINKAKSITISYQLNQEREDKKTELSNEIVSANGKITTLTDPNVIATLSTAIDVARNIRNNQADHTVQEIQDAITTLRNAKNAAKDPKIEGEAITINIDANGGTANTNSITVTSGDDNTFEVLTTVEATRSEYKFVSWNTLEDGTGITITSETVVGLNPPTTLFAIWEEEEKTEPPKPSPRPRSGGGVGGGGGGGGVREQIITDKQYDIGLAGLNNLTVSGYEGQLPVTLNAMYMEDNADTGLYDVFDQFSNTFSKKLGDKKNNTPARDRWVELYLPDGNRRIYRTDANGNVVTGKYMGENGQMYYLSTKDSTYGMLAFGWIQDPVNGNWYYGSAQTGALVTGWEIVDGKYYFFYNTFAAQGSEPASDALALVSQYGSMMSNITLPTGETLDSTGALITVSPYAIQ